MTKEGKKRYFSLSLFKSIIHYGLPLIILFSIFVIFVIPHQFNLFLNQKKLFIKEIVGINIQILEKINTQLLAGTIDQDEALRQSTEYINFFRWSDDGNGYTFVIDYNGKMIVHPYHKELEQQNVIDLVDKNGVTIIKNAIMAANSDNPYFKYHWDNPIADLNQISKITYAKKYEPLGWVLCSGIYYDDIKAESKLLIDIMTILVGSLFLSISIIVSILSLISLKKSKVILDSKEKLEQSEAKLFDIFSNTFQFISLLDKNGNIVDANKTSLAFCNEKLDNIKGLPFWDSPWWVNAPLERKKLMTGFQECKENKQRIQFEIFNTDINAGELYFNFTLTPLQNKDGTIRGFIAEGIDISEKKRRDIESSQRERMESIGKLAGGIAHDFNNMLAAVQSAAELLGTYKNYDDQQIEYLDIIGNSVHRASVLTEKLLSFSRFNTIKKEPIYLNKTIEDTLSILRHTIDRQIQIRSTTHLENAIVIGNSSLLLNAFLNIALNSSHAIDKKGSIDFNISGVVLEKSSEESQIHQLVPGDYVQVTITDTGCGIKKENISKIFTPFYTNQKKGEGTGLGLSSVYTTIQEHSGAIIVTSQLNKGTEVKILLPLSTQEVAVKNKDLFTQSTDKIRPLTILAVDDEFNILTILKKGLNRFGHQVITANNGAEGLSLFKKNKNKIDLVILDMIMPEMNGNELFSHIKRIKPEMKVILTTGFTEEGEIEKLKGKGLDEVLQKPYRLAVLKEIISKIF